MDHIPDDDLERYYLGMVAEGPELAALEEHLLSCSGCAVLAEQTQDYISMRCGLRLSKGATI